MSNQTAAKPAELTVGMGQIAGGQQPQRMTTVVGSCIALALHNARLKFGVLAHIVLPDSAGRPGAPGKFADTAIPRMLEMFRESGVSPQALSAKFAGGANMFGSTGPLQIGDANIKAVTEALRSAGVRITDQDVGGSRGRRVTFNSDSGTMTVESPGQPAKSL
jgi:chemotaxis protein CheD